ncbi:MAG TPA: Na(+)-translocating NADH-quinone reductase subunit A [Spirochaetota bacterium]|nr:Na(+)-translocating NADH-quinone reductase subunit A [Spirochaetota bacterium]
MANYRLKKGYDIRIAGEAEKFIERAPLPESVGLYPADFYGMTPKPLVEGGERVKVGTPLWRDKRRESLVVTSPVSGTVAEVRRGERRVLGAVVIRTDGKQHVATTAAPPPKRVSSSARGDIIGALCAAGLFPLVRQRPFGTIADPQATPRDIFVTAMDTAPLAPDQGLIIKNHQREFQRGIDVLAVLTPGKVHLCADGGPGGDSLFDGVKNVEHHRFAGPHPAGNVGVHIHHVSPIRGAGDIVWHCTVQGVILIGRFFIAGAPSFEVTAAVAGPAAARRRYVEVLAGAEISSFAGASDAFPSARFISGNVLTGRNAGADGFLGFGDNLVTIIPETKKSVFLGWLSPGFSLESFSGSFVSRLMPRRRFAIDTNRNGSVRAFVATGIYERLLPMDILPLFLLKSILAGDIEEMEKLGILDVTPEDFALCEYACPSKTDIQRILRDGIDLVLKEARERE